MIYLWPSCPRIKHLPADWGVMTSPAAGMVAHGIREGRVWACDNEAFTVGFDFLRMMGFLRKLRPYWAKCLFVVCPDKVGDADETIRLWHEWHWVMPRPLAFVAQDGQEERGFPRGIDALFIGGTTEWKLSDAADDCIRRAKRMGLWVHVGRVNSMARLEHFMLMEVASADGTKPTREPRVAERRFRQSLAKAPLFNLLHDGLSPGYRAGEPDNHDVRPGMERGQCVPLHRAGPHQS